MTTIDCHVHPTSPTGGSAAECGHELLRFADRVGIEMMGVSLGPRFFHHPVPEQIEADNEFNARLMKTAPDRFFCYTNVNPNYLDHSLREIDRRIRNGPFVGVKLWVAMHCDEPNVAEIIDRCIELGAVILQHTAFKVTGNYRAESRPTQLARLAMQKPEATFIAAHAGIDWERGLRAVADVPNVFVDTCGFDPELGFTESAVELLGAGRVVYGSDAAGRSFASQIAKVHGADITDNQKQAILGKNIKRVLHL